MRNQVIEVSIKANILQTITYLNIASGIKNSKTRSRCLDYASERMVAAYLEWKKDREELEFLQCGNA